MMENIIEYLEGKYQNQSSFYIGEDEVWLPFFGTQKIINLRFEKDWNWLMFLVEKLCRENNLVFKIDYESNTVSYTNRDTNEVVMEMLGKSPLYNTYLAFITTERLIGSLLSKQRYKKLCE